MKTESITSTSVARRRSSILFPGFLAPAGDGQLAGWPFLAKFVIRASLVAAFVAAAIACSSAPAQVGTDDAKPEVKAPPLAEFKFVSSLDQTEQVTRVWAPERSASLPTPMLVFLHSWSGDYTQDNTPWLLQAEKRGWIFLHPNFRGINKQPQACGSKFARQDVLDAIDAAKKKYRIDASRIYLAGTSGGGHMSMLMGAYHPERFSAVSAWVGISDLADWYRFHVKDGKPDNYAQMTVACLGGPPGHSTEVDAQYRERSPLYHLHRVGDLPIELSAGVTDGHNGSVPIRHSLLAFNVIAKAGGHPLVTDAELASLAKQEIPSGGKATEDATYGRDILFRRAAGPARVTIFQGGHEGLPSAACDWLSRHTRTTR
ncbi:MAG TPA: prolyl oligopeptidase family serine peptidase [Pirellulaceae bacterium]|nr:prolyl oligopeptidase family serine peptidase [Pirellulaceae bacterium]